MKKDKTKIQTAKKLVRIFSALAVLVVISLLVPLLTQAAIKPMNDSSNYRDEKLGLSLSAGKTNWTFFNSDDYASNGNIFVARPVSLSFTGSTVATLTLRSDKSQIESVKKYTEKWLRDYPKFGFELQQAGEVTYGDLKGYQIEMVSKKVIHQFIYKNDNEFLVFTCSSGLQNSIAVWEKCQEILRSAKLNIPTPDLFKKL